MIWDTETVIDGEVSVELKMAKNRAAIGGLLLRVSEPAVGADNWNGYEVSLDATKKTVFLGEHRHNWLLRREQPVDTSPDVWHKLRVVLAGKRVQIFVDDAKSPQIDEEIEPPLVGGLTGLRTWASEIEYRNFEILRTERSQKANWLPVKGQSSTPRDDAAWARHRALEALCRSVLNLNEFVYAD